MISYSLRKRENSTDILDRIGKKKPKMTDNCTRVILKNTLKDYFVFPPDGSRKFLFMWHKGFFFVVCLVLDLFLKFITSENTEFHCFHEEGKCMLPSFNGQEHLPQLQSSNFKKICSLAIMKKLYQKLMHSLNYPFRAGKTVSAPFQSEIYPGTSDVKTIQLLCLQHF